MQECELAFLILKGDYSFLSNLNRRAHPLLTQTISRREADMKKVFQHLTQAAKIIGQLFNLNQNAHQKEPLVDKIWRESKSFRKYGKNSEKEK